MKQSLKFNFRRNLRSTLLLIPLSAISVHAGTVYQYYDEHGAVTFSDTKPTHTNDFIVIDMPDPPVTEMTEPDSSLDEMIAVTEALEALRREKAAMEEEERERLKGHEQSRQTDDDTDYDDSNYNYGYDYSDDYRYGGYPFHTEAAPPYKYKIPGNPAEKRLEELKTPIRIPQFNSNIPLHEQLKPYNPPAGPSRRRR